MGEHIGTLHRLTRRRLLQLTGLAAAPASMGLPGRIRASTKELVIGGAGGHTGWMKASVIPPLQNTEGMWTFFFGAHLETGKPLAEAQYEVDARMAKILKHVYLFEVMDQN